MTKPAAKKRRKNPENLYPVNGIWNIRYQNGGELVRRSLHTKSVKEAKRLRDQILAKRTVAAKFGIEAPLPRKERTFGQVLDLWLQWRKGNPALASSTTAMGERHARLWLRPFFGRMLVSEITVEDIERFIADLRTTNTKRKRKDGQAKRLSEAYVTQVFTTFRMLYRQAVKRDWYTGPNPIDKLDRKPRRARSRDITLTEDEAKRLLDNLTGELRYKVGFALTTGLRWGEVHGLAWQDIELDGSPPILGVKRSFQGKPKNQVSMEPIPLSDDATALLRRWRSLQGVGARYVFPDTRGELRKRAQDSDSDALKRAAEQADIAKNITPHVLRHTFGTWLFESTGDLGYVRRLMRHASITTSMGYVHDRRELGEIVNRLPRVNQPELKAA